MAGQNFSCPADLWYPFMRAADIVFGYRFSEINKIRKMCETAENKNNSRRIS